MIFIGLVIGIALGVGWRELYQLYVKVKALELRKEKSQVTYGSYKPPDENRQTSAIINPKTPQRIEFEAKEEQRREALGVGNNQR